MLKKKFCLLVSIASISLSIFCTTKANAASPEVKRIWGADRYETCSKIVQEGWKSESQYAVIVNGENFPDALSASVLAKKYEAPILLTEDNNLGDKTYSELKRLNVKKVFIVGGKSVVTSDIENSIKNMGIDTERLSGEDRSETSAAVANEIGTENGVIITTDNDFTDALSIAPMAAKYQMPIVLMPKNEMPSSIEKFMTGKNIPKTYIIGGTDVISEDTALKFPNVERIDGKDEYERNINIINAFGDKVDLSNVCIAYSEEFADALSGSAFAAINGNPIILMGDTTSAYTKYFLNTKANAIKNVTVFGGDSGIKDSQIQNLFNSSDDNSSNSTPSTYEDVENNGSVVVKQGDWVYYSENTGSSSIVSGELYKEKSDGSGKEKLSDDLAQKIWIQGDYIYYINYKGAKQKNCFYRMKKDGTERQQVTSDTPICVNFQDGNIYYIKYDTTDVDNFRMYKIKEDGTGKQAIGNQHGMYLKLKDNWLYYANIDDGYKLYKMRTDGSDKQLLCEDPAVNYMNIVDDWIYYCNNEDNNNLYKIKLDGSEKQKLNSTNSRNISILGNYIYYSAVDEDYKGSLYKMKLDGSENKMLSDVDCSTAVEVHNDYIYCCGANSKGIYRIKTDGSGYENINKIESIISLYPTGDWVYYVELLSGDMSTRLHKMKLDGSSNK
jgi:putative cell wall-binding protein